jgi:cellulose synthase operon protein C
MKIENHYKFLFLLTVVCIIGTSCSRDPNVRKQKYLESGERYLQKGKYAEAEIQFSNAIQVDSRFAEAHYQLAQACLKLQQWTPAYQELSRTVELQPDNYAARLDLANLLIAGHQFKDAQEQTDYLLEKQPSRSETHTTAAALFAARENLPSAIAEMQKAIILAPDRWEPYLTLASLQQRSQQFAPAQANFAKAVDLNPKSSISRLALANFLQSQGRLPEAEKQINDAIQFDPRNPELYAALVKAYMQQGKKPAAEELLKESKQQFRDNPAGYRMLGDFYFSNRDYEDASDEYASLYREHPNDLVVKKNYVQLLIMQNRLDEAGKLDDEVLKNSPQDVDALIYRGQIDIHRGSAKDAIETLQRAVRNDPGNGTAYYNLGVALQEAKRFAEAENAWQSAVRLRPDMSEAYLALAQCAVRDGNMNALEESATSIINLVPDSPAGYAMRALSFTRRGQWSNAEHDANKAIALAPQAPEGYLQMGNLRFAEKRYGDAESYYEQTLERDPASRDALGSLADAYVVQGQTDKAISRVQAEAAKHPSSAFYDLLGTIEFEHRRTTPDLELAQASFRKSLAIDQKNSDAWLKMSQVQAAEGKIDDAIASSQHGLEQDPQQIPFYVLIGRLYESQGKWDAAKQSYQKALEIDPENPQASNNLAYALAKTGGNLDVALSLAQTARRNLPDSPNVADTLGWVFYQRGAYTSAIDSFLEALKLTETTGSLENPTVHFHLGLAYEKTGQNGLARRHLERVLKLAPNYSEAGHVRELISQLQG